MPALDRKRIHNGKVSDTMEPSCAHGGAARPAIHFGRRRVFAEEAPMSDPRFHSIHLEFPRRQHYREQRDAALGARGMLTRTAECAAGVIGQAVDSSLLPGAPFYLVHAADAGAYALKVGLNAIGRLMNND